MTLERAVPRNLGRWYGADRGYQQALKHGHPVLFWLFQRLLIVPLFIGLMLSVEPPYKDFAMGLMLVYFLGGFVVLCLVKEPSDTHSWTVRVSLGYWIGRREIARHHTLDPPMKSEYFRLAGQAMALIVISVIALYVCAVFRYWPGVAVAVVPFVVSALWSDRVHARLYDDINMRYPDWRERLIGSG